MSKTLQGHRTKLNQKTEAPTVGIKPHQTTVMNTFIRQKRQNDRQKTEYIQQPSCKKDNHVQYNHDRVIIIK